MAPSSVEQALRENIQLKVEFQTLRTELKRYKKLLLEGDKALRNVTEERDSLVANAKRGGGGRGSGIGNMGREKEWERELKMRKEERDEWEKKARELQRLLRNGGGEEVEVRPILCLSFSGISLTQERCVGLESTTGRSVGRIG